MMKRPALLLLLALAVILVVQDAANACLRLRRSRCIQHIELTPAVAKQALLDMMRSDPGQLGFFEKALVDEMATMDPERHEDGSYHWTGAYRIYPAERTYLLFVSIGHTPRPPLREHPKGYLLHLKVYEGSFALQDGRWIATVPQYRYALLD